MWARCSGRLGAFHITIVVKRTGFRSAAFVAECHKPCTAATCLLPRSLDAIEGLSMALYKYLSEERITIFEDGLIRFTQPRAFNDPFEFRPHLEKVADDEYIEKTLEEMFEGLVKERYASLSPEERSRISEYEFCGYWITNKHVVLGEIRSHVKEFRPIAENSMYEGIEENIGVLSLTECPENLLMWAHYSNSHQGFVVEFDDASPYFSRRLSDNDELRHLRKVCYEVDRPKITLTNLEGFDVFLVKGDSWKYEKEWRMLLPLNEADLIVDSNPYNIHLFKMPYESIKSVYIGCRATDRTKKELLSSIVNNENLKHIKVFQTSVSSNEFNLEFEQVCI